MSPKTDSKTGSSVGTTRMAVLDAATEERVNIIGKYILDTETFTHGFHGKGEGEFSHAALFDYAITHWVKALEQGEALDADTLKAWTEEYTSKVYALRAADKNARGYGIFMRKVTQDKVAVVHAKLEAFNEQHGIIPMRFLTAARGPSWRFMFWITFKRMVAQIEKIKAQTAT